MDSHELDPRYVSKQPFNSLPKPTYALDAEKGSEYDPRPGKDGYFAVLLRVSEESPITNRDDILKYVKLGQKTFQKMRVTSGEMERAQEDAKAKLASKKQSIKARWNSAVEETPLKDEERSDPGWLKWVNLYTETIIYKGQANQKWVEESEDSLRRLKDALSKAHQQVDFGNLASAVEERITATQNSYINPFTCLYTNLGERAAKSKEFEKSLEGIVPIFRPAPDEAPSGSGRNARWGAAPCADVVAELRIGEKEYVSVIKFQDNWKLPGGKCEPRYDVTGDFRLRVTVDTTRETALKEFLQESGADVAGRFWRLDEEHIQLLDLYMSDWKDRLLDMGCVVDGSGITWSEKARDEIKDYVQTKLSLRIAFGIVPDTRTTQNSGYVTTVYGFRIDEANKTLTVLFLALSNSNEAESFLFRLVRDALEHMQSTHKSLFEKHQQITNAAPSSRLACGDCSLEHGDME